MNFVPINELNKKDVLMFLSKREHTCVQLVEKILLGKFNNIFCIQNNARRVTGVLSVGGTVLHCLPDARNQKILSAFKVRLAEFLHDKKISCVNGEAIASRLIIDILREKNIFSIQQNDYILMTLHSNALKNAKAALLEKSNLRTENSSEENLSTYDIIHEENIYASELYIPLSKDAPYNALPIPKGFSQVVPPNWHIIRCYENSADALMHLQIDYEKEEVTPKGRETKAAVVRKNLERLLQEEYVLALQNQNQEFVSKANTNAIGMHYAQIGGVFTAKQYRGRHFASLLVESIIHRIIKSKRRPVLYVQTNNESAKSVYKKLGFSKSQEYTITYF
ncbi:MAG: GNAT family N-acetyltransferase [Treponema sp.]|nr:GNAT family N-acetyltransferase [Treponema sp.]